MATYILLKESEDNQIIEVHGLNSADTRSLTHNCGITNNASAGILRFNNSKEMSALTIPKILNETSRLGYQVVCSMSHHHEKIWTLVKHKHNQ